MIDAKSQVLALDDSEFSSLPETVLVRCVSFYRGLNVSSVYEAHGVQTVNSSKILEVCGNKLLHQSSSGEERSSYAENSRCLFSRICDAGGG